MEAAIQRNAERPLVRYSEVLSALSFVLDMVEGQPEGHVLRSCYIGMTIGERLGLNEEQRSALFYALLLKDAGCSSNASKVTALFGADDFRVKRGFKTTDWSRLPSTLLYIARTVSPGGNAWSKTRRFLSVGMAGPEAAKELVQIRCERGAEISRLIGFPEATARAIRNLDEHWDGAGHPDGLEEEEIPLLSRICGLAQTIEVFFSEYGPERAEEMVRSRRKRWFDPALVDVFLAETREGRIWERLAEHDLMASVWRLEPAERTIAATPERLDLTARAFAQIIDAKSPFTFQHSEGVARIAAAIGEHMGLPDPVVRNLTRAGLLHDIGKLGVPSSILDKPGPLTVEEMVEIRKHPRLTGDILARVAPFRNIAEVAANHHERLDGSGYPRRLTEENLNLPSRILAVADVFDALSQDRPYRPAMPLERVLAILSSDRGERLCPLSIDALIELASKSEIESYPGDALTHGGREDDTPEPGTITVPRREEPPDEGDEFEEDLIRQRDLHEALLETLSAVGEGLVIAEEGRMVYANDAFCRISGYKAGELMELPSLFALIPPERRAASQERLHQRMSGEGGEDYVETVIFHKSGRRVDLEVGVKLLQADGRTLLILVVRDITGRKRTEEALRRAEEKYRSIFENAVEGIFQTSLDGSLLMVNPMMARIFGYEAPEEMLSSTARTGEFYVDSEHRMEFARLMQRDDAVSDFEAEVYRKDGSRIWVSINARTIRNPDGKLTAYEGTMEDATKRKALEEQLEYQAFHDALTGLPNRALFLDRLDRALARADRRERNVAILFLDLDDFKAINDSLGHMAGDVLLAEVARRIETGVRQEDTTARLGGDEFIVLLEDVTGPDEARQVASRIEEELREPFYLPGGKVSITASIGVAFGAPARDRSEDLLRVADADMYRAKNRVKGQKSLPNRS